jgi:peptidoglycan/LPS O-acetylase OafA/YrhL
MSAGTLKAWLSSSFELGDHNRRLPSMEGLRGLAILLVFASHYHDIIGEKLNLPAPIASLSGVMGVAGGAGVDLFFLLSGFLIYRTTLRPALNVGSFLLRRAERIYPAFLVVFAAYLALGAVHLGPSRVPSDAAHGTATILANVFFLPGIFDMPAIIGAAWSLSYEWFFYLVLPVAVLALQFYRWNRTARIAFLAVLCVAYEALCVFAPSIFPTFNNFEATHVRLIMFVSGMLVYELLESDRFRAFFRGRNETIAIALGALCGAALLARIALTPHMQTVDGAWSSAAATAQIIPTFLGFSCLGLVVLRNDGPLAHLFTATWLRWTGNISYSFYLVHSIPMHWVSIVLDKLALHVNPLVLYIVAFPFTLALTYAVTAVLFIGVEKPLSLRPRRAKAARPELQAA